MPPDALPLALLDMGFALDAASHMRVTPVTRQGLPQLVDRLRRSGRPVDVLATRSKF